ncbi:MAG: DUF5683 domain-containing protein [Cyclobacteriaceae bacterium]
MKSGKSYILAVLLMLLVGLADAQVIADSTAKKDFDFSTRFSPRRALYFSSIMPGLGQVYNRKYWKVPIFYAGFAAGIYVTGFYQDRYVQYRNELLNSLSTNSFPSTPSNFTEATLRRAVDFYQRKRDATLVFMGIGYLLQIVDAHVDAHLKDFKYNPNLRVSVEPVRFSNDYSGTGGGLALTVTF